MAEGNVNGEGKQVPATEKEWVVPVARDMDLSGQKPWALQTLYDLFGWKFIKKSNGKFDVDQESVGPQKREE